MIFDLAEALWQPGRIRSSTDTLELVYDDVDTIVEVPVKVLLFNDNIHTFDEVIAQVSKPPAARRSRVKKSPGKFIQKGSPSSMMAILPNACGLARF